MAQQSRKLLALAALLALASENVSAFTPSTLSTQRTGFAFSPLSAASDDVSIDYDSAAKLAYDDWRNTFGKGDFSEPKFEAFKSNYVSLTVANVKAAKQAREEGGEPVEKLELNDFADMTVAEYQAMQDGGSDESVEEASAAPVSPLQVAMDAMQAQEAAGDAIGEAAAAIAEEEQKLVEKLGLDSVEELEEALDAMDGVAPDGGELDTSISREARVRSAYMEWCKEYGKETDELRFPTFSSNYLAMESYAKDNGKSMQLNKYADCSEEEYIALTTGAKPEVKEAVAVVEEKKETVVEEVKVEEVKAEEPVEEEKVDVSIPYDAAAKTAYDKSNKSMAYAAFKAKYEADAVGLVKSKKAAQEKALVDGKKAAEEKKLADEKKAAEESKKAEAAKKAAADSAAIAKKKAEEAAKSSADIEKEKQARQAAQEKARAAASSEAEDAAIAAAREVADKEAAQIARRRELDTMAADQARQKAQKTTTAPAKVAAPAPAPVPEKKAPVPAPVAEKKAPAPAPVAEKKAPSTGFFGNIFGGSKPKADDGAAKAKETAAAEAATKQADAAAQKDAAAAAAAAADQKQAEEAAAKKQAEEEAAKAKAEEAAAKKQAEEEAAKAKAEAAAAKKQADAAAAKKKAAAPKKKEAAPKKKEAAPLFGGFFANEKKSAPKAAAPKTPTPPPAETAKKVEVKVADPVSDAFSSFFGGKPAAPKDEPAPSPAPTPPPAKPASFNFFGGAAKPAAPAPAKVESEEKKAAAKMAQQTLAKAKPGATISLSKFFAFGGAKKEAKAPPKPPTLTKWYQNNDGSVTGEISGSNAFEEGELVTTSPIEGKPGKETVVVTVSGSRYFLDTVQGQKPFFNFGAKPKQAETAKPAATVALKPKPVVAKKSVAKKSVAKKSVSTPPPAPTPAPAKPASFNFFGGAAKPAPKEVEPTPSPAPKPAFSLFGGAAKPSAPAVQKTTTIKKPAPVRRGTITLGSPQAKATQQKAASTPVKNDGIPVLKNWSQEADGSVTGNISNSKVFRVGQKITTSPVPKGAKPGSVVTTSSGSKYRLN